VYDRTPHAVGLEIAEILGLPRPQTPDDLKPMRQLDYVVVSEPRARFGDELTALAESGAQVLTPSEAITLLCGGVSSPVAAAADRTPGDPYTIEDTLSALERLLDRRELLKFLLEVAVKATGSRAGSIMLYSAETKELHIAYATGLSERVVKNTRQKLGEGVAGNVALTKQAQLIHLPSDKSLYARDRERLDIASAISVPLLWGDRLLGVVNVSSAKKDPRHTESDVERLKTLSRRLSRVLYESLKLQDLQMRHRESRFRTTVGEIAEKDISSQEKLSVLCSYLAELTGADTSEIYLNTAEGDWLVLGGSSRLVGRRHERLRYKKGALTRAFLEKRCIVLTESVDPSEEPLSPLSSAVYCNLALRDAGGVLALEFSDRLKLEEFVLTKDSIIAEVSRFVGSELRERTLRRKLAGLGRVSDAAAALLGCRSIEDLGGVLARVVADVLECDRVSVRLRSAGQADATRDNFLEPPGESDDAWKEEDRKQYERLATTQKPFALAFLGLEGEVRESPGAHGSLLAVPVWVGTEFHGGIIAYGKRPGDPIEDGVFTPLDQSLVDGLNRLILPVLEAISARQPLGGPTPERTYDAVLEANRERFVKLCESEITRSNRYHHAFAVILFRMNPLQRVFSQSLETALQVVDGITQGIRTRTRKTDYGCWIGQTTYAILSLEGSNRIRFMTSRAMLYLMKDLAEVSETPVAKRDILVGVSTYPGIGRTADELLDLAEKSLSPQVD
jgi:putative methionine-R-sulfoxide reductase with GAF domain